MPARARASLALALLAGAAPAARAFDQLGFFWLGGTVTLQLQLGEPAQPLSDGSRSWNAVAAAAAADWNAQLGRVRFATVNLPPPAGPTDEDRVNNVFFARDAYGLAFDDRTLAVTIPNGLRSALNETDVLVNSAFTWDSYRGALRRGATLASSTLDLRRVLLHEFGHVLGLDHPDEAVPRQAVSAIMNSVTGNVDTLQADDIAGVRSLYFSNNAVAITAQPAGAARATGERTSFTVAGRAVSGGPLRLIWMVTRPGGQPELLERETDATLELGAAQPADAGTYQALLYTATGAVLSDPATLTVRPAVVVPATRLANLSTRGFAGTGGNAMICGFVVSGTAAKSVLIRAIGGGTLGAFGVAGALADPELTLFDAAGRTIERNGNWDNQPAIAAAGARVGAFALPGNSTDAALLVQLPPGSYTARVTGAGDTTGTALVEVYDADLDPAAAGASRLGNLSTRGSIGIDGQTLIAGLVVRGPGPRTFLLRAVGPTLRSLGVADALLDSELTLRDAAGATLRYNDDWDTPWGAAPGLRDAARRVGGFALQERRDKAVRSGLDSVMLVTLPPGNYTAEAAGFRNANGVALIEIYEMPN